MQNSQVKTKMGAFIVNIFRQKLQFDFSEFKDEVLIKLHIREKRRKITNINVCEKKIAFFAAYDNNENCRPDKNYKEKCR